MGKLGRQIGGLISRAEHNCHPSSEHRKTSPSNSLTSSTAAFASNPVVQRHSMSHTRAMILVSGEQTLVFTGEHTETFRLLGHRVPSEQETAVSSERA